MTRFFSGVYTALVTPFTEDGEIDLPAYDKLIERQIASGVAGIVPCGTTGESPTLSFEEKVSLITRAVEKADGKLKVIAGTGTYATRESIDLTVKAARAGADACMLVNPYYNKPTQEGLYRHFRAVAEETDLPVLLYNIKGRTGVNLETKTLMRLVQDCPTIRGVKEASGDLSQVSEVIECVPASFSVLSGDDNLTAQVIGRGGQGVVSVASNVIPERVKQLVDLGLAGDFPAMETVSRDLLPFFEALFIETNPIPVKTALVEMGLCREVFRLPLCEMQPENRRKACEVFARYGL